jgi:hypothetical protein
VDPTSVHARSTGVVGETENQQKHTEKERPIREAAREGRKGADAYVKVFRYLLSTTVLPGFLGEVD